MAILVVGFDGYDDLWEDFFSLLSKYWSDCPYKIYLVNNERKCNYDGVTVINVGENAEWSLKVSTALEHIKEKYICLLLEDLYFGEKVENGAITKILNYMEKNKTIFYKLKSFSKIKTKKVEDYGFLYEIPDTLRYGISLQAAIWHREFLKEKVGKGNYNAWKFECDRIAEEQNGNGVALQGCVYDNRNILQLQHGVVQGEYLPRTLKYFKEKGYELNQSRRQAMSEKQYFIYRCKLLSTNVLPARVKIGLKKTLNFFGIKFITDKHA